MSKELTPLEALENLYCQDVYEKHWEEYKIIETALKDGEWYKQEMIKFEKAFTEENEEKLKLQKVLEIIKEKQVAVDEFIRCCKEEDDSLDEYNAFAGDKNSLTQEEFDLLKEVLCKDNM